MAAIYRSTRILPTAHLTSNQANQSIRSFSVSVSRQPLGGQKPRAQQPGALPRWSWVLASQYRARHSGATSKIPQTSDEKSLAGERICRFIRAGIQYVDIPTSHGSGRFHPVFLRDACTCPRCVDPSSTQKLFQTTAIPANIRAKLVTAQENGDVTIEWENDIPGFGPEHVSTFTPEFVAGVSSPRRGITDRCGSRRPRCWDGRRILEEFQFVNFEDYMKDDKHLFLALAQLKSHGLLLLRNVPESEESVAQIANRIGTIRDTFYGRTWDVKSVPKAQNLAYTHQSLGLHMDLLYMANPPGFQLLHCMKNTCQGGDSLFSDSFNAAVQLSDDDSHTLATVKMAYHYRNAGEHYYYEHPVFDYGESPPWQIAAGQKPLLQSVNYSPPFQALIPLPVQNKKDSFPQLARSLRKFAREVESPRNLYSYRPQEGDCMIFNNRRILHGRRSFELGTGERWLKGTYIDTDVFDSKWRVLHEQFNGMDTFLANQYVHPGMLEEGQANRAKTRKTKEE